MRTDWYVFLDDGDEGQLFIKIWEFVGKRVVVLQEGDSCIVLRRDDDERLVLRFKPGKIADMSLSRRGFGKKVEDAISAPFEGGAVLTGFSQYLDPEFDLTEEESRGEKKIPPYIYCFGIETDKGSIKIRFK